MPLSNFERMIQMAEEVFAVKDDPNQLNISEAVIQRLQELHPNAMIEVDEGEGPNVWVILIPTTTALMNDFIAHKISEKELFELTPLNATYDALYLCSAMVLEEFRRKGLVTKVVEEAFLEMKKQHPIKSLFVWSFTPEGNASAEALARRFGLPLFKRKNND